MATASGSDAFRDPSDAPGDSGDQAQDLRSALEQEAIAAALAGHVHGDSEVDRDVKIEDLEGEDPLADPEEGDSSDDPLFGGGDITGHEPVGEEFDRDEDEQD